MWQRCCGAVEQVVALYKYQRQNPDELTFEKGCVINVISKAESDWWTGELNGQTGLFPSNYVVPLSSVSESDLPSSTATCKLFMLCDLLLEGDPLFTYSTIMTTVSPACCLCINIHHYAPPFIVLQPVAGRCGRRCTGSVVVKVQCQVLNR